MTFNIFSIIPLWSRTQQSDGHIGEIECIDMNVDSISTSNPFSTRINDFYIGTTDGYTYSFYYCVDSIEYYYYYFSFMIINQILNIFYQLIVILTTIKYCFSEIHQDDQLSNQLFNILGSLQPFRSQFCQFKFENCIQDSSYADQLDNDCNIYSRLRDCFRSLLDETQCLTIQLRRQYKQAKQNEYESCGITLSLESINSSINTSSSFKININYLTVFFLFIISISLSFI
ncbi:unnamed protein product [Rotaria sordida]|uniref:Transmembrane protein n=2 Tax=Rotaria sordida TaxID=392033 RepID=A0A813TPP7_9BILA|nr:unnamed protein product [Rotaria sordida]CAF0814286.1 unnamed protein product [Rotaria sordida]